VAPPVPPRGGLHLLLPRDVVGPILFFPGALDVKGKGVVPWRGVIHSGAMMVKPSRGIGEELTWREFAIGVSLFLAAVVIVFSGLVWLNP
jgi:hypothetical protein